MAYGEQWNAYTAFKAQAGKGAQATGAGALVLPESGGQGGRMTKAAIESGLVRQDGMQRRGRHGSQKTSGAYNGELIVGATDPIFEAIMRGNWSPADLSITEADMTSITTTEHTIVAAAGDWIAKGLRVGDVIRLVDQDLANADLNIRISGLSATTITTPDTLVPNAVADTDFAVVRKGRKLINPGPGQLLRRYFTVEEHEYDLDASELFTDCMFSRLRIAMAADGNVTTELGWTGTGQFETKLGAQAPFFPAPADPVGVPMAALEASLRVGTQDLIDLTSFDVTIDLQASTPSVTGPSKYAPDVFLGTMAVSMNLTVLRKDLLAVADFINEQPLSLHFLAGTNPETGPADFFSLAVPNFTYGAVDKSAVAKAGGARTETRTVPTALVGIDERGGAYDRTMIKIQVSNAA
ncbi:MAG TPA: phage tail tube protein [Mesorhizobium sp.]|jgi:hypothetical protein|uniref:phage tail tube protein n=1 Tax=Mesorhizobium sp. TaxID=1871066 RepID=UPI002DDCF19A|nr:phage tail tube protein [Mesorhizobium sp.]HEV2502333.1 phage tail tube protein [Mesorhizobium sp.]